MNHSFTLNTNLVSRLPAGTRSPLNLLFALAGTTEAQGGMTAQPDNTDQMFSMFGLQRGRSGNTQILIDGTAAIAPDWGGLMAPPTIDSVDEMQVIRNTYDVQYGNRAPAWSRWCLKGGSTSFHGGICDFLRNDNLDATDSGPTKVGSR
jgi:hypothetical protein